MNQEYSKEFFWDTYKKLPEDLKEALFSDKNNEIINHICIQSGLTEEQAASVAKFTGRVLMGLLPLDELPITIELELNISQDLAGQINRQIYISIFKHLRVSLNKINDKNFSYQDQFTSESDGIEEDKKRREEVTGPKTFAKPFPSSLNPILPKQPVVSSNVVPPPSTPPAPEAVIPFKNKDEPVAQTKEPPFSYNELVKKDSIIPSQETVNEKPAPISEEKEKPSEEIAPPVPVITAPSRSAFEEELQKESIPFPDIPVSFPSTSIPSVAINSETFSKDEVTPPTIEINKTQVPSSSAPSFPVPQKPLAPNNDKNQVIVPEIPQMPVNEKSNETNSQNNDDPYKETLT